MQLHQGLELFDRRGLDSLFDHLPPRCTLLRSQSSRRHTFPTLLYYSPLKPPVRFLSPRGCASTLSVNTAIYQASAAPPTPSTAPLLSFSLRFFLNSGGKTMRRAGGKLAHFIPLTNARRQIPHGGNWTGG